MKRIEISKVIISIAAALFAAGWLAVLAFFLLIIKTSDHQQEPLELHKVEELGLFFLSDEEDDRNFESWHAHTIFFLR